MKQKYKELTEELVKNKIKPSYHRIRILGYLYENNNHLTVDKIFLDLKHELPTLSKTTVYNTLKLFINAGIVRQVTSGEKEAQYEIFKDNHGHFKCTVCKKIYDFDLGNKDYPENELEGFMINDKAVYFTGICKGCLK